MVPTSSPPTSPNFDLEVKPIELDNIVAKDNLGDRWDKANVHDFRKVSKVFPELWRTVL